MVLVGKDEYRSREEERLREDRERKKYWKRWGPYVSERQWATGESPLQVAIAIPIFCIIPLTARRSVREDYS